MPCVPGISDLLSESRRFRPWMMPSLTLSVDAANELWRVGSSRPSPDFWLGACLPSVGLFLDRFLAYLAPYRWFLLVFLSGPALAWAAGRSLLVVRRL